MLIHYYDLTAGVKKGASRLPQRGEGRGCVWGGLQRPSGLVLCLGKEEDSCTWDVAECAWRKKKGGAGLTPAVFAPQH